MILVKVAFVGCGQAMLRHREHLVGMDDVQCVGYCDDDQDRAADMAARFGGEAFTHHEAMYDKVRPEAVYVTVPPFARGCIEASAAERGIHLFVEKPVALDRSQSKAVTAAISKTKVLNSVGYCLRYNDAINKARNYLKGKSVSLVTGRWIEPLSDQWWWRRLDKSGGQMMVQTTHMVDLVRYLCGDFAEVYAAPSTGCMSKVKDYDIHDSSVLAFRLKNGAVGSITSSCVTRHRAKTSLEITTPEATVRITHDEVTIYEEGTTTSFFPQLDMYHEEKSW